MCRHPHVGGWQSRAVLIGWTACCFCIAAFSTAGSAFGDPAPLQISDPNTGVSARFDRGSGTFLLRGAGAAKNELLVGAYLRLHLDGKDYRYPQGIEETASEGREGQDHIGSFQEIVAHWQGHDADRTPVDTSVRIYAGLPCLVFAASFPSGALQTGGRRFQDVGCSFPVFDPPEAPPRDSRWLSYTYQDWPMPIRGGGWPEPLPRIGWPAAGSDDGIREPLILFRKGSSEILSPLDHPLQQIVSLSQPPRPPVKGNLRSARLWLSADGPTEPGQDSERQGREEGWKLRSAAEEAESMSDFGRLCGWLFGRSSPRRAVAVGIAGTVDELPAGASFRSILYYGSGSLTGDIPALGALLQRFNGKRRRVPPADLTLQTLGYWTDNGSAYYYHNEGNANYQATLGSLRVYHREAHIPVRYYQLDSWWYPKGPDGGVLSWSPDPIALPDGAAGVRRCLDAPVALHNRYWSTLAPDRLTNSFSSGPGSAVPITGEYFTGMMQRAVGWGCILYEQDWMGHQLRRSGYLLHHWGAPEQWLGAMDQGAAKANLPIQYCMPTVGCYLASTAFPEVTQIRTSRDFDRRDWDSVRLRWMEFCQMSLLARAVGAAPSKDVFLTSRAGSARAGKWEQSEALLAALSCGPAGIGDAFGGTDNSLVERVCLEDGTLVHPDSPALPVEAAVTGEADEMGIPLVMESSSRHGAFEWRYALSLDLGDTRTLAEPQIWPPDELRHRRVPGTDLLSPLPGAHVVYDYMAERVLGITGRRSVNLASEPRGAGYAILAPLLPGGIAVIGDTSRFAAASKNRIRSVAVKDGAITFEVLGPARSLVHLCIYRADGAPLVTVDGTELEHSFEDQKGLWHYDFRLIAPAGAAVAVRPPAAAAGP